MFKANCEYENFDNIKKIMKCDDNLISVLKQVVGSLFLENRNYFCDAFNDKIDDINTSYSGSTKIDESDDSFENIHPDYVKFIKDNLKDDFAKLNDEHCKDLKELGFIIDIDKYGDIYCRHILDPSICVTLYLTKEPDIDIS